MTLILTELSPAGIAMAADSKITYLSNGKPSTEWKKLLPVPKINAGVSYWGHVGLLTQDRFDHWLKNTLDKGRFEDLPALADYLTAQLNSAANNKALDHPVGLHVAGYHLWSDGIRRPTFYHVHNGHGHVEFHTEGLTINGVQVPTKTTVTPRYEPRQLFSRHNDFAETGDDTLKLIENLKRGFLCKNGDYGSFIFIAEGLQNILSELAKTGAAVSTGSNELGRRVGLLKALIEITIAIYKLTSLPKLIGGSVSVLVRIVV